MAIAIPAAPDERHDADQLARMFFEELRKRGYVEGEVRPVELYSPRGKPNANQVRRRGGLLQGFHVILTPTTPDVRYFS